MTPTNRGLHLDARWLPLISVASEEMAESEIGFEKHAGSAVLDDCGLCFLKFGIPITRVTLRTRRGIMGLETMSTILDHK